MLQKTLYLKPLAHVIVDHSSFCQHLKTFKLSGDVNILNQFNLLVIKLFYDCHMFMQHIIQVRIFIIQLYCYVQTL